MYRFFFISILLIQTYLFQSAKGQSINRDYRMTPTTPEAATLAKMVNYPVNHNTGIPDIRIPLHEVKIGSMTLPLELSYHAGGFKINERATSTGLGWALSCDLQITRSINDKDDLMPGTGYIFNINMDCNKSYPLNQLNAYYLGTTYDGMPDRFYYKLLSKSGSFYFVKYATSYSIVPIPYDDVKIEYFKDDGYFIITDTDGTRYQFGEPRRSPMTVENYQNFAIELAGVYPNHYVSAWKCVKVKSQTDSIEFIYNKSLFKQQANVNDCLELYESVSPHHNIIYPDYFGSNILYTSQLSSPAYQLSSPRYQYTFGKESDKIFLPYINSSNSLTTKTLIINTPEYKRVLMTYIDIYGLDLQNIRYRGGNISISRNGDMLQGITINENNEYKYITLYQSYTTPYEYSYAKHLNGSNFMGTNYLDSLKIGNDVYTFYYYSRSSFGSHCKGSDAWGYTNSRTFKLREPSNYTGTFPVHDSLSSVPYVQTTVTKKLSGIFTTLEIGKKSSITKELPNESYMKFGVLRRIVYPTGGYVDFDYECNKYSDRYQLTGEQTFFPVLRDGGGLRIKSILQYNGEYNSTSIQKYYRYGENEEGTGYIMDPPALVLIPGQPLKYIGYKYGKKTYYSKSENNILSVICSELLTKYFPMSGMDYTYASGAPVYYTKVTEYNSDLGVNTGKTVYQYYPPYHFSREEFSTTSIIPNTNVSVLRTDWHLVALKSVSDYTFEKGKYKLVRQKKYDYQLFQKQEKPRVAYAYMSGEIKVVSGNYTGSVHNLFEFQTGQYSLTPGKLLLTKEEETLPNGGLELKASTEYFYDNSLYTQPSRTIQYKSGQTITTTYKYPYDRTDVISAEMKTKNMISPILEEIVTLPGNKELSRVKVIYKKDGKALVRHYIESSSGGNALEREIVFDKYDKYGNLLQATNPKSGVVSSYIWGYASRYLVAEITGIQYTVPPLSQDILWSGHSGLKNELEKLYAMPGQVMVNTYVHKPLFGIQTHTDARQYETGYDYDHWGRLIHVRDQDNHITQAYSYHSNKKSATSSLLSTMSIPMMETFVRMCGTNSVTSKNHIYQGSGIYMDNPISAPPLNIDTICQPVSSLAKINFNTIVSSTKPPPCVSFDFIQDGHIVATKSYLSHNFDFYLPEGEYTISYRTRPTSYNSAYINCSIGLPNESGGTYYKTMENSEAVYLKPGFNYMIGVAQ